MKFIYLFLIISATIISPIIKVYSQPDTLWTRVLGRTETEYARDVQQTEDVGFIVLGTTESYGSGWLDVWLVKTTEWGEIEWSKTFGGINADFGSSLVLTSDGNYVLTGFMENMQDAIYSLLEKDWPESKWK